MDDSELGFNHLLLKSSKAIREANLQKACFLHVRSSELLDDALVRAEMNEVATRLQSLNKSILFLEAHILSMKSFDNKASI